MKLEMSKRRNWLALAACLALFAACAGRRGPELGAGQCSRMLLEPHPLWTAGAAWRPAADQLVLVDPEGRLLEFSAAGVFRRHVRAEEIVGLDYSSPVRLLAAGRGYLLGGRDRLLRLGPDLEVERRHEPFAALGYFAESRFSDFALAGRRLWAYADFSEDGDEWRRGFVRLGLERPRLEVVREISLTAGREWSSYYFYDLRPYVAAEGRRAYALRFAEPPEILRAGRHGLEPLVAEPLEEGFEARALHAWGGSLYLLARRLLPSEEEEGLTLPELEGEQTGSAMLQAAELAAGARYEWRLHRIDPATGRRLASFRLPTRSQGLLLLPGEPAWGLIESPTAPNTREDSETYLLRLPAARLEAPGHGLHTLACPGEPAESRR